MAKNQSLKVASFKASLGKPLLAALLLWGPCLWAGRFLLVLSRWNGQKSIVEDCLFQGFAWEVDFCWFYGGKMAKNQSLKMSFFRAWVGEPLWQAWSWEGLLWVIGCIGPVFLHFPKKMNNLGFKAWLPQGSLKDLFGLICCIGAVFCIFPWKMNNSGFKACGRRGLWEDLFGLIGCIGPPPWTLPLGGGPGPEARNHIYIYIFLYFVFFLNFLPWKNFVAAAQASPPPIKSTERSNTIAERSASGRPTQANAILKFYMHATKHEESPQELKLPMRVSIFTFMQQNMKSAFKRSFFFRVESFKKKKITKILIWSLAGFLLQFFFFFFWNFLPVKKFLGSCPSPPPPTIKLTKRLKHCCWKEHVCQCDSQFSHSCNKTWRVHSRGHFFFGWKVSKKK